jgi:hypothetical protein
MFTISSVRHMPRVAALLMLFLAVCTTSLAGPVSESAALRHAKAFLAERGRQQIQIAGVRLDVKSHSAEQQATDEYYVFNLGQDEGFVVVSGDDRIVPILGYADSGSICDENMPDGLLCLLDDYAKQIKMLDSQQATAANIISGASQTRQTISPLIKTKWNQSEPFNNNCPLLNETTRAVTGCVATAMAQVMYYHQWPKDETAAIPGFINKNQKIETVNTTTSQGLNPTTFKWDKMTLSGSGSDDAEEAVAELMQYCGWSLCMYYGTSSSAFSVSVAEALTKYFGYDSGVHIAFRRNYSYIDWIDLIYSELAAKRPVHLGGQSSGGGHAFVCDGYQGDDYFHINWGWGGKSDGYFRLSILNPYDQGIGGSTTSDGFSFGQEAIVGIQKPDSGSKGYCLSLEALNLGDNSTTKTFTRSQENEYFPPFNLSITLFSYMFGSEGSDYPNGTNDFDFMITMKDDNNHGVIIYESDTTPLKLSFNLGTVFTLSGICFSVPDSNDFPAGTYYIKVWSRLHGTSDWQECHHGDRFQLTATVTDTELTINVPIPVTELPKVNKIQVNGDVTKGHEQEVTVSLTGGATDYKGDIVLRVDDTDDGNNNGIAVMGREADIPAGQTVDVRFVYTPTTAGKNVLTMWNAKSGGTQLKGTGSDEGYSTTVQIKESDATDNLDLGFAANITNLTEGGQLYGNAFRANVTVTNSSTTNSYAGQLNCSVRKWTSTTEGNTITWKWEGMGVTTKPLIVPKNNGNADGSTTLQYEADGLERGVYYSFRFTYTKDGKVKDAVHLGLVDGHGSLTATDGYSIGNADGTTTVYPISTTPIDAGDACFLDLRNISSTGSISVSPSSNPNCLYLLADGAAVPNGLPDYNVIRGTTAEKLILKDEKYDFYSPIDFTANEVSYTRVFSKGASGSSGWETLMLPFDVDKITCIGIGEVDWFRSATDTGKNFWLKAFTSDNSGRVDFDYASTLSANTPYIIAVPGDTWGSAWDMTKSTVTFSAENAAIAATAERAVNGNNYKFIGNTVSKSLHDVYMINSKGNMFVKKENATSTPFRAWFSTVSISSLALPSLSIGNGESTGIIDMPVEKEETTTDCWYTPDGRRINGKPAAKGLYIHNGKKLIIR